MPTGPTPYYQDELVQVHLGDCLDILPELPGNSVDAVVTDPPYALNFMGRSWDKFAGYVERNGSTRALGDDGGRHDEGYRNMRGREHEFQQWCQQWAAECLRILRPGGHLLAFGGTRTSHRLACAVEDAGFEIRDSIAWLYGSGFPKSLDVSKAIDKAAGAEREVVATHNEGRRSPKSFGGIGGQYRWGSEWLDQADLPPAAVEFYSHSRQVQTTAPATPEAEQWQGWGTALKPAHEPIIVARKPLTGTVAANVLRWGTGALNIDAGRIEGRERTAYGLATAKRSKVATYGTPTESANFDSTKGRWPANVALDETQAAALDQMSGELTSGYVKPGTPYKENGGTTIGQYPAYTYEGTASYGDTGGASRFYFTAKASTDERIAYWRLSCDCETVKPWSDTSQPRDTDGSSSTADRSWNTSTSGSRPMDEPSPGDTTSTTETSTSSTTTPPTSSSSPSSSTSASTPAASSVTANGGSPAASATSSSPSLSSTGTSAPKAGPSTAGAAPATLRGLSETSVCGRCGAPAKREAHATVKPLSLMRWLVRLVTPPGGTILEPFAGSGTTVEAALLEGFRCIAIEREADYLPLITQRINRRRDPIAYLTAAGDDLGLFGGVA